MPLYEKLLNIRDENGAGFFLLLDPDHPDRRNLLALAEAAESSGVDIILVGGSFLTSADFDACLADIKRATSLPVILFPGSSRQIARHADGVLFLSLISGRNPTYLIDEQVKGAPLIKAFGLEAIPTGYILVESGRPTSVQFISGTMPIPRDKDELAVVHALAAEYLGMKLVYLEAGSGAVHPVPERMITAVADGCRLPVIVGGGIGTPEQAASRVAAGASFIVIGTRMEKGHGTGFLAEMAAAIHSSSRTVTKP